MTSGVLRVGDKWGESRVRNLLFTARCICKPPYRAICVQMRKGTAADDLGVGNQAETTVSNHVTSILVEIEEVYVMSPSFSQAPTIARTNQHIQQLKHTAATHSNLNTRLGLGVATHKPHR